MWSIKAKFLNERERKGNSSIEESFILRSNKIAVSTEQVKC